MRLRAAESTSLLRNAQLLDMHDFQARRSRIRYRPESQAKPLFTHTLNNTAIASPRFLIPLLELNQQKDGSVVIPEPLRPYMNGIEILEPK